ncbi:FIG022160: hypothetical toxin [uncultured Candidatus Thioglobus sp.]|nr:FIG022160: hypothetical toxin [uncultured Candidatus Thioglobus sp.]
MEYEIIKTNTFDKWLYSLDAKNNGRVLTRLDRVALGNLGDHKQLNNDIFELRLFFGSGYRVYYTIKNNQIILLLCGGDKKTQSKDIKKAQ